MSPEEYCQNRAARSGSSFYYSFLFLDPPRRQAITALYAFCREVDDVVDETADPDLARIKLQWWRDDIALAFDGQPQHPVSRALVAPVREFNLSHEQFLEVIDGMEMDLDVHHYDSFRDLSLYCHRVAGVVGILSAEIFGYEDRMTLKYAHELGVAFQLTNILRDVMEDAKRGRIYLPGEELEAHGVSRQDILHGISSDNVRALLGSQARRAHQYYTRALTKLPEHDRYRQRSGLIMSAIYETTLNEIENEGFRVFEHRTSLTPLRKFWIAWSTARREKRRHRKHQRTGVPG